MRGGDGDMNGSLLVLLLGVLAAGAVISYIVIHDK